MLKMSDYKINIVHLYPDLLNLYGDKGNIECLKRRLLWRNIDVNVFECTAETPNIDFENCDIIFLGGGSDREQEIVCSRLLKIKDKIKSYVENGGTMIAVCGGFELLGSFYGTAENKNEALDILPFETVYPSDNSRFIGNVVIECDGIDGYVVGFENHAGRIDIGDNSPLGKIKKGYGNDGRGNVEGMIYKNVVATYLHGPLFPKNPQLCDRILINALKHKYDTFEKLAPLDDNLEIKANEYMTKILL